MRDSSKPAGGFDMPYDIIIGRDETDKKRFGKKGLIFLGKGYVTMGQYTSLSNPIFMDIARSHVVLVSGKRGSGKCLHEDTLINLADGSQIPIKDLENNKEKILSLNNQLKIQSSERTEFFSREVERLLKIKLRSGKEIKLTPEHPLLTIKGWTPAQELTIGSRIATPRKSENFGKGIMEDCKIKMLAYLIAEGHTRKSRVLFSTGDDLLLIDFKESIKKFNKDLQVEMHSKSKCYRVANKNNRYSFKENPVKKWLKSLDCYGYYSKEKWIPQEVFKLNKENLALFLNRLFSCDGSIYKNESRNGWEIDYSSSSKKLIYQVQSLLLKFGILSKIRKKKTKCNGKLFDSYELILNPENTIKFIEEIGFYGEKAKKQERAIKEIREVERNPNIDTIPKEIWETYRPKNWADIGRFVGYKYPKAMRERIKYAPSRQTLLSIAKAEQSNPLYLLATSDIFWDEIISMEILEGKFKVYDICVPENHNFIANEIIVHNSYTLSVIAEELTLLPSEERKNISGLIFDTMGIFWTMKYENDKERELLEEWNLKPKKTPVKIFIPFGYYEEYEKRGLPVEEKFSINPAELESEDWILTFNLNIIEPVAVLIERTITELKEKLKEYTLEDIIQTIKEDKTSTTETKNSAIGLFESASTWKVFSETATPISELIQTGKTTILDLSMYSSVGAFNIRALVIGLICKKIFNQRMLARKSEEIQAIQHGLDYLAFKQEREMPLIWIFIDECLTGDTEIITDKSHTLIKEIIAKFNSGEEINVFGFDTEKKEYLHYPVTNVYSKGKRKICEIITESGNKLRCTPEHRVLTRQGFFSAFSVDEIATPLIQYYSKDKECIKARIIGHLFGDGWASKKSESLGFSGKVDPNDLDKIKKDLAILGLKSSNICSRDTISKITNSRQEEISIKGKSHSILASFKAFRYFEPLGILLGDKVKSKSKIPEWIKNADEKVKAEFLAALMGSDGSKISKAKYKGDYNAIRFSFNKLESLEENAFEYANEIKQLFESLGVQISNISKKSGNIRKNGDKTIRIVITIKKDIENTIRFLETIGYRYCDYKEMGGKKWLEYLKARLFLKKEREKVYKKALDLHSRGLGKVKISRELNFSEAQIRDWIYSKIKPGLPKEFLDIDEWISKRIVGNLLFERVFSIKDAGEEEVYDISVDKVHNFVSNGLITHNCHEFLPEEGKTSASDALIQILREGRQPGLSLVMATQQPGALARDAITQADIIISHRVTALPDVQALNEIMQSYLLESIKRYMDELPALKGSAIILDDNSERIYPMRIRPKFTWHGGEAPTAIRIEKRI